MSTRSKVRVDDGNGRWPVQHLTFFIALAVESFSFPSLLFLLLSFLFFVLLIHLYVRTFARLLSVTFKSARYDAFSANYLQNKIEF